MRDSKEIIKIVLDKADSDERIRGVLLSGSRADPKIPKDPFQDYDIIYVVKQLESFLIEPGWIDIFGDRLILQMPEQMTIGGSKNENTVFHYLMLFKDGTRIDLTLVPVEKSGTECIDGCIKLVLSDKDHLFAGNPAPEGSGFIIKQPSQKEFLDTCNEFWWVSTYVPKGLARDEIPYAKEMLEIPVRSMFMKMIEWHIGVATCFSVSFGKSGRFMKHHLPVPLYLKILSTYPDEKAENIWKSLFMMTEVFSELATRVASSLNFDYDFEEERNVKQYLHRFYEQIKKSTHSEI